MFDWLFEGQAVVYALLACALVVLAVLYWQRRRKVWLYAMLGVVALIGLYFLLDRLVETDQEQVERSIQEIGRAATDHNVDAVFDHISDDFRNTHDAKDKGIPPSLIVQGKTKKDFREYVQGQIGGVNNVIVWDFNFEKRPNHKENKEFDGLRFRFKVQGLGLDNFYFDCKPQFVYEEGKGWRIKNFTIFKPGTTEVIPLPF